jgi:hypothetical protein
MRVARIIGHTPCVKKLSSGPLLLLFRQSPEHTALRAVETGPVETYALPPDLNST